MDILVIGSGGREHALALSLAADPCVTAVHVAPGNAGTAEVGTNHAVAATDPADVVRLARELSVDLVVIGPEAPLVAGVADALREWSADSQRATRARDRAELDRVAARFDQIIVAELQFKVTVDGAVKSPGRIDITPGTASKIAAPI